MYTDQVVPTYCLLASLFPASLPQGLDVNYTFVTMITAAPHLVTQSPNANPLNHSLPWCVFLQRTFLPGRNYISCRLTCALSTASVSEGGQEWGGVTFAHTNTQQNKWQSWGMGGFHSSVARHSLFCSVCIHLRQLVAG